MPSRRCSWLSGGSHVTTQLKRYQIRVRQSRKVVLHESYDDYFDCQDALDDVERQYDPSKYEIEYRDTKEYGPFR